MPLPTKQSSPSLADNALRLPTRFPELPGDVLERFPSTTRWGEDVVQFFQEYESAIRDFAGAVQDTNELGGLLIADRETGSVYIRPTRGSGNWAETITPFFVNREGFFSLGSALTWNPVEKILRIIGEIIVTSGTIGGFDIGPDYIRDSANSFGLSSAITGGDDVRFWAGDTFANRATAPFRVYESGAFVATNATISGSITATSGSIGGFSIGSDYIRDSANTFGLASTVTGSDDVRFWAGDTFANRATAPFRVYESGIMFATSGTLGAFTLDSVAIYAGTAGNFVALSTVGIPLLQLGDTAASVRTFVRRGEVRLENAPGTRFCQLQPELLQFNGDTNIYSDTADELKTDDKFLAALDIETLTVGKGFILPSPDGTRWRIAVSNAGALSAAAA